jgi:membrane protein implicated in regulation of membrane protease activity
MMTWAFWAVWWVWVVFGAALAVLEVLVPGFIFLGFAIGAALVGVLVLIGVLGGSVPVLVLVFAVLSLAAWLGLRRVVGVTEGQVKVWDKDING